MTPNARKRITPFTVLSLALVALCVFPVARYYVASGGASLFTG